MNQTKFDQRSVQHAFVAKHLLNGKGADQQVGPERNGDQQKPEIALMFLARGDEIGGGKADDQRNNCGDERQFDRPPEDCHMGGGKSQRVIEHVAFKQHVEPGVAGKLPVFHIAVVPLRHDGIQHHHGQRPDGGEEHDQQRRGRQPPAGADVAALRLADDFLCVCHDQSRSTCAASPISRTPTAAPGAKLSAGARLFCRRTMKVDPSASRTLTCVSVPR